MDISQYGKFEDIIKVFDLINEQQTYTPIETNYYKNEGEDELIPNKTQFRQDIRALLFIINITRPDISTAVNLLSRRNEKPRKQN
ncbi:retrovirus-related Pol polyprotein from transposon TNT 1-94 [Caerostris extrusa]|uniref:Retrovirus-related Pol polyprotein from transposon TNT 1-94 n=1 Tax=Caerostris extrusa TaxID=172846 RepID=A0AAV4Q7G0_CAEEX|nr:retrovirus-related Pol polyprotein from transposon TNT 1-94 [Caerostris extrusa]